MNELRDLILSNVNRRLETEADLASRLDMLILKVKLSEKEK